MDHLLDTTQGHTIVDETIPPNLEGLDLASHRVCCALDNISSWCRSRASVGYGSVTPDAGTIGFNVKSKIQITDTTSKSDQTMKFATENKRAIPSHLTLILSYFDLGPKPKSLQFVVIALVDV